MDSIRGFSRIRSCIHLVSMGSKIMVVKTKENIIERDVYIPAGKELQVVGYEDKFIIVDAESDIISHYLFSINDRRIEIQWET